MGEILLTMKQASDVTKLAPSTLRFYERRFRDWIIVSRSPGGQRQYSKENLKKLIAVKELLEVKGFSIRGARMHLELPERLNDE
jgi:DNA-binding transcriptional MerR regulator